MNENTTGMTTLPEDTYQHNSNSSQTAEVLEPKKMVDGLDPSRYASDSGEDSIGQSPADVRREQPKPKKPKLLIPNRFFKNLAAQVATDDEASKTQLTVHQQLIINQRADVKSIISQSQILKKTNSIKEKLKTRNYVKKSIRAQLRDVVTAAVNFQDVPINIQNEEPNIAEQKCSHQEVAISATEGNKMLNKEQVARKSQQTKHQNRKIKSRNAFLDELRSEAAPKLQLSELICQEANNKRQTQLEDEVVENFQVKLDSKPVQKVNKHERYSFRSKPHERKFKVKKQPRQKSGIASFFEDEAEASSCQGSLSSGEEQEQLIDEAELDDLIVHGQIEEGDEEAARRKYIANINDQAENQIAAIKNRMKCFKSYVKQSPDQLRFRDRMEQAARRFQQSEPYSNTCQREGSSEQGNQINTTVITLDQRLRWLQAQMFNGEVPKMDLSLVTKPPSSGLRMTTNLVQSVTQERNQILRKAKLGVKAPLSLRRSKNDQINQLSMTQISIEET